MSTNLKFITGLSGEAHVKPAMDAQWHSAINGAETFVYDYGQKFALTVNQAMSTMSIASGVGQIQGRLFIIEESLIETISYPNVPPEVGLTRIDTVLLHWGTSTRIINGETVTVNTCEFEYKKNPLANGQPESFAETDLNLGDTDAYYPMWHVTWNENGIQEVETIFTVVDKATVAIDTTAPTGTTDGDLYAAIVALGWENDVIGFSLLNNKKTLTKLLAQLAGENLTSQITGIGNFWSSPKYSLYKHGNRVFFYFRGYINLADYAANSLYTLCTIPSAARPSDGIPLNGKMTDVSYNYKGGVAGAVNQNGTIKFSIETHTANYFSIVADWSV